MRLLSLIAVMILTACNPVIAGEYQEKPVMCGPEEEIFPILRDKDETLLVAGQQLTKVRDPDESNGLSQTPAVLPFALYVNLDNKTYTVLEYHNAPYNVYCIISYGVELKLGDF
tara:strand:- start:175 stop:516 length:342 start_codon:yes stop_codon:yes gene_type:complete